MKIYTIIMLCINSLSLSPVGEREFMYKHINLIIMKAIFPFSHEILLITKLLARKRSTKNIAFLPPNQIPAITFFKLKKNNCKNYIFLALNNCQLNHR